MMTAAIAAMMAASAPMAFAQTTTTTTVPPAVTGPYTVLTTNQIRPEQIRLTQMNGATVYDTQNRNIGDIKDMILDRDGRVAAVVLDVGSFLGVGGKYVAVPMNDLTVSFDDNNKPRFSVARTKEQLKAASTFDLNEKKAMSGTSVPPADRTR
jgi:sporulation protein YlmC with PRC-barrel domain